MKNMNYKLSNEEKERLDSLRLVYKYTREDIIFLTNIYNQVIDNTPMCLTCTNKINDIKNAIYGWYASYKDRELKEQMEAEHKAATEAAQAKLAELKEKEKKDKLTEAKSDIKKYVSAKDKKAGLGIENI